MAVVMKASLHRHAAVAAEPEHSVDFLVRTYLQSIAAYDRIPPVAEVRNIFLAIQLRIKADRSVSLLGHGIRSKCFIVIIFCTDRLVTMCLLYMYILTRSPGVSSRSTHGTSRPLTLILHLTHLDYTEVRTRVLSWHGMR
jgi:hypothetical protein